jgi:hypothetical protein
MLVRAARSRAEGFVHSGHETGVDVGHPACFGSKETTEHTFSTWPRSAVISSRTATLDIHQVMGADGDVSASLAPGRRWRPGTRRRQRSLVRERGAGYDPQLTLVPDPHDGRHSAAAPATAAAAAVGVGRSDRGADATGEVAEPQVFAALEAAVDEVVELDLDPLTDEQLRDGLRVVQRSLDRLSSVRSARTAALQQRAARRLGPGREGRAKREAERFLVDELNLSPSEAKKTGETGRRLEQTPQTAAAFADGKLGPDHARVITEVVRHVDDPEARGQLEEELTELATRMDPVALGREARRRLARLDQQAAVVDEARRHGRRYFRASQQPDGMVTFSGAMAGIQGEALLTAYQAFIVPDGNGVEGTREQRAADALAEVCLAALRAGEAPTQHGVRPHVSIVVQLSDLAEEAGAGELDWTGPITVTELRRWIRDASVTGVLLDPDEVPVGLTERRPTVRAHLRTALKVRDGGCRWPRCSRPPAFCDGAHTVAVEDGGPTHLSGMVLLCREHHRKVDLGRWRMEVDGTTVTFHAPDGRTLVSTRGDPP